VKHYARLAGECAVFVAFADQRPSLVNFNLPSTVPVKNQIPHCERYGDFAIVSGHADDKLFESVVFGRRLAKNLRPANHLVRFL
jgi:hypothetical protein